MTLEAKTVTCDCGNIIELAQERSTAHWNVGEMEYVIIGLECPVCHREASGGNCKTGEVFSWMTQRQIGQSQREFEAMQFDADMNEWYGRGNW